VAGVWKILVSGVMGEREEVRKARGMLEKSRYSVDILPTLFECVEAQARDGFYEGDVNLAVLKLFQFHPKPHENVVEVPILLKILALALMRYPASDFKLCLFLVPSAYHHHENVSGLVKLAEKLEACQYVEFWQLLKENKEVINLVPGLEETLRKSIFDAVALTYQEIPCKELLGFLNSSQESIEKQFDVVRKGENFVMPANPYNQPKQTTQSSGQAEVQFPQLASALAHSLF